MDQSLDYLEKSIPESILTRIAKTGRLKLVERADLQSALDELKYNLSDIVDEQKAIALGRQVGANAITIGSFVSIGDVIRINSRVIDVETGGIIYGDQVQGKTGPGVFDLIDVLAESIEESLMQRVPGTVEYQPIPIAESRETKAEGRPFYRKWWFWAVVVSGGAAGIAAASSGGENPSTTGNIHITW